MYVMAIVRDVGSKTSDGYEIRVFDDKDVRVDTYSAGGNPQDSQQPGKEELGIVRRWARSTAREMFEERFGRPPRRGEVEVVTEKLEPL